MKFETLYGRTPKRYFTSFDDEKKSVDRTKQSFKDECDVNKIVDKYPDIYSDKNVVKSIIDSIDANPGLFTDFDSDATYQDALAIVQKAEEQFNALPVQIRDRFKYNPTEFLSYVSDPANIDEMQRYGLIINKPVDSTQPVIQPTEPVVTPTVSSSEPIAE